MTQKTDLLYAEDGRTYADSLRITVRAKNPKGPASNYRRLSVCVYNLAAKMERKIDAVKVRWASRRRPSTEGSCSSSARPTTSRPPHGSSRGCSPTQGSLLGRPASTTCSVLDADLVI